MTTETIDIRVREDGSRVVKRNLEGLDPAARKAAGGVDFLKRALAGFAGGAAVAALLRTIDTYTNLQNRLRSVGLEGNNLTAVYRELLSVSNQTRSSVASSTELYARLANSSKELGASQSQLIDFTKSLNQAIILSGASAQEAEAGLIQLSQGLASGTLRGDELRSVLEQLPAVADVIAKGLGVTRGELRKLGEEGKITAKSVLDAFAASREELEQRFGKTVPTLSQSFQVLKNNAMDMVGELDKSIGVSEALSKAMLGLAGNLETVTKAVAALVSGLVLVGGAAVGVRATVGAVQALTAAIAANPVGALLVLLTSVITALVLFRDEILLGVNSLVTLGDWLRAVWQVAGEVFGNLWDLVRSAVEPIGKLFADTFGDVNVSMLDLITSVAKIADTYIGIWRGAVRATVAIFEGLPPALADIFTRALNVVLEKISKFVNKAGELLSTVTEFAGLGSIATNIDFRLDNASQGAATRLGQDIQDAFMSGFNEQGPAQEFVNSVVERARGFAEARREAERFASQASAASGVSTQGGKAKLPVDQKEIDKLKTALASLLNTIDPVTSATLELAKAQQVLHQARAKGLISADQEQRYLERAQRYYDDLINPLGKINREMREQSELLRLNAHEREVESQLLAITQDLYRQGVDLTADETQAMRAKLQALRDLNLVTQEQDRLYEQSIGKRREFETQLQALQNMLANPEFTTGDQATATADLLGNMGLDLEGTQVYMDALTAQFQTMYSQIDALRKKNLLDEQTAQRLQAQIAIKQNEIRLANTQTFFSNLAVLSQSGNKKVAAIGRAAAIAQATIDGILAVQKALASAPPPANYALAIAAGAVAAANVAQIAGIGFKTGGYTGDASTDTVSGFVHGQEFVNNAASTRRNRGVLEWMNDGGTVVPMQPRQAAETTNSSAAGLTLVVNNTGTPQDYEVEGVTANEVRIIARDVARDVVRRETPDLVAGEIRNPNSKVSKQLGSSTSTSRRRP